MPARLPAAFSSFVGRQRETENVIASVGGHRLTTVVGVGGVGKTRLAAEAARRLEANRTSRIWWVDLSSAVDSSSVLAQLLATIGRGELATMAGLVRRLKRGPGLLVLDNCERAAPACPHLVEELLDACPELRVLATSREPFRSRAEACLPLAPLPLGPAARAESGGEVPDAVRLFAERAQAVQPGFRLDHASLPLVSEICRRLDGIPLAIELAAARVEAISLFEISRRLDQRLELLRGGPETARAQHHSLRAALDWSYNTLPSEQRSLFRSLSVFAGGWRLEAAEAVCATGGRSVLEDLTALVAKSLVVAETGAGDGRYRLLETVREYGAEKLLLAGRRPAVKDRHCAWAVALMERLGPLIRGAEQSRVFAELDAEHENLLEAIEWALSSGQVESGLRITGRLWWYWFPCGYARQGAALLGRLLAQPEAAAASELRAGSLEALAVLERDLGDAARAVAAAEEALGIRRRLGDRLAVAESLVIAGWAYIFLADFERARELWSENLRLSEEIGAEWNAAEATIDLGWLDAASGDLETAAARLERGVAEMRRLRSDVYLAYGLFFSAFAALQAGRTAQARAQLAESLAIHRRLGGRRLLEPALTVLAGVAAREGAARVAIELKGAAQVLREELGLSPFKGFHDRIEAELVKAERALGGRAAAALARGRELDFEAALDQALGYAAAGARSSEGSRLSNRQALVAGLVAEGMSNREIAMALSLAEGTVKRHVEDILGRLGVETRAQIAAWAVRNLTPARS